MLKVGQTRYLEKHRVYEMFRNMVQALVMCRPSDPLLFIARYLKRGRHADVPKIMLVGAPATLRSGPAEKVYVALEVAKSTGVVTIDRQNVLNRHWRKREGNTCLPDFVTLLTEYMRAKGSSKKGWLLLDIPNSREEADRMISLGILPTHTIVLNYMDEMITLNDDPIIIDKFDVQRRYKNLEYEIKTKFRFTLKELCVHGKSIDEVTELCLEQIQCQKPSAAPFVPRIVIIGPKGSRRFVTAHALSKTFDVVHVDFDQILLRNNVTNENDDDDDSGIAGERMRSWLKDKITENDCVEKGYVLSGFPRTRNDLEWLDSTETAPNRVIFLAVDFRDIYARLKNRCVDKNSGGFMSLDQAAGRLKAGTLRFQHVGRYRFDSGKLYCDYKTYCGHLKKMLYYCGDNCSIVTVNGHEWSTCNKIKACVAAGSPAAGPRPQDRKPSRLTKSLSEIMFESGDDVCATRLSDDAQHLLNALERRDEQQTENVTYATPLDIFTKCQ